MSILFNWINYNIITIDKFLRNCLKNRISQRIVAIESEEYDFLDIFINLEFTIRKKYSGEIVECGNKFCSNKLVKNWNKDSLQIEESSEIFNC